MATTRRSAGKAGQFKYGSPEYKAYMRRKEVERRKRGLIDRSRKKRSDSGMAGGSGSAGRRKVKKRGAR